MRDVRAAAAATLLALIGSSGWAGAATLRAGQNDLIFGLGAVASQTADIDSFDSVDAGDGTTLGVRWRHHFTEYVGIEIDFTAEWEETALVSGGFRFDEVDSETNFFFVNILLNLTRTPVSPYVAAGLGRFDHQTDDIVIPLGGGFFDVITIEEDGSAFDLAVGVDGRSEGALVWALEARLLNYEFDGFREEWERLQFSGHLGFRF